MITKVFEGIYRGPRPDDLNELLELKINTIISLESHWYDLLHEDEYERQYPCEFGIDFFDMGCSDLLPPEPRIVKKAIGICNQPKRNIFIHCLSGVDRTGFICAAIRMDHHWKYQDAYREWVAMGRHWWYDWWKFELKKYETQ